MDLADRLLPADRFPIIHGEPRGLRFECEMLWSFESGPGPVVRLGDLWADRCANGATFGGRHCRGRVALQLARHIDGTVVDQRTDCTLIDAFCRPRGHLVFEAATVARVDRMRPRDVVEGRGDRSEERRVGKG